MPEVVDSTGAPTPRPDSARYRPARANFSTDVPFDHLHRAAQRAELVEAGLGAAAAVAYEWDLESDRVSWGGDWSAFAGAGFTAPPTTGKALSAAVAAADRQHRYEAMFGNEFADDGDGIAFQLQFRLEGGDVIAEEGRWYTAENGSPQLARGLLRRLAAPTTANSKSPARASKSAEPTGEDPILSRAGLAAALGREIGQSVRTGGTTGLLLIGIDRLSMLNRAYGFEVADRLIEAIWRRVRDDLPMRYMLGRYTGNKLGVVLPRGDSVPIDEVAKRVLAVVNDAAVTTDNGPVPATVSVGSVQLPEHGNSAEMAMLRAEEALATARDTAQPACAAFVPSSTREHAKAENLSLADRIVTGLNERRFHLHYQPVVRADNAEPSFYECLLRLTENDGSVTSAGAFMPAAEELGLARLIDHRVLELVLEKLEQNSDVDLSLNISPITVASSDWLQCLKSAIRARPELADRLIVEITETVAIKDVDAAVGFVRSLRRSGCRVAMDDFGAGYTSFRNLKLLNVDMVKIDGEFVRGLSDSRDDQAFVRALIDLAGNFGLETVAECVERAEDADLLASWGVGCFQGYFYGRPAATIPASPGVETNSAATETAAN